MTDLRSQKIPNWLTYPAVPIAILLHWMIAGKHAALLSLAGAALGLAIFLPVVLLRGVGGGDWELVRGLRALFGPHRLVPVLLLTLIINGIIALGLILWRKRVGQTFRNLGRMTSALFRFRSPGLELTIDNPETAKVPFG